MSFWLVLALAGTCAQAPTGPEIAQALSERAQRDAASTFSAHYRKEWRKEKANINESKDIDWQTSEKKAWEIVGNGANFDQITIEDTSGEHARGFTEKKVSDARRTFVARYSFSSDTPCIPEDGLLSVSFKPRTDVILPNGEDEDELLNHLSGKMYIDTNGWYVRAADGHLTTPFSAKALGKVTYALVQILQDDKDGVVVANVISAEIWAEFGVWKLRKHFHFREIYQFLREPSETTPNISPE